jgi:hypothetical protein
MYVEHTWLPRIWLVCGMLSERATWHAFYVVQTWTHDVPPTWRRTCTLDIKDTLIDNHPYWKDCYAFSGQTEQISTPIWVFATEFVKRVEQQEEWLNRRTQVWYDKDDLVHVHGVKWIFFFVTTILGPKLPI